PCSPTSPPSANAAPKSSPTPATSTACSPRAPKKPAPSPARPSTASAPPSASATDPHPRRLALPEPRAGRPAGSAHDAFEVGDGAVDAFLERDLGCPAEVAFGQADVRLALTGGVGGQGMEGQLRLAADLLQNQFGEFDHGEFAGVAEVDRAGQAGAF